MRNFIELTDGEAEWDTHCLDGLAQKMSGVLISDARIQYSDPLDSTLLMSSFYEELIDTVNISGMSHMKLNKISPESLATTWKIPIEHAKLTLQSTTQNSIQLNEGLLSRRFKTQVHHTQYRQLGGYLDMFALDTFKSHVLSTRGNSYIQLFCNRGNFCKCYPTKEKRHAHHALNKLIHEVGVPNELLTDGAKELTLGEWGKTCRKQNIHMETTEPHLSWYYHSERIGGIVKCKVKRFMRSSNTPIRIWDYCWEYVAGITSLTATGHINLDGVTPFEKIYGYTPNIAEYLLFSWYQWVWYYNPGDPDEVHIGRWLGPSNILGQCLASLILSDKGKVITRSSVSPLSTTENISDEVERQKQDFTTKIESVIGNYCKATANHTSGQIDPEDPYSSLFENDAMDNEDIEAMDPDHSKPEADEIFQPVDPASAELNDEHLGLNLLLPRQGEIKSGKVVSRKQNYDGTLIGNKDENPALDSRKYTVDFRNGECHICVSQYSVFIN